MDEILSKEEFMHLSRARQQEYAEMVIFKMIEENPSQGITLQELRKKTPFSISTILKYTDVLLAKRRIYKVSRGSMAFYFPNGTPVHEMIHKEVPDGRKTFRISLIQNNLGKQIYVQEFELDDIGMRKLAGGIMISRDTAGKLAEVLSQFSKQTIRLED